MSNKQILLTFVGGNDIKSENAAIEQILKEYKNIKEVYIFLTKAFEKPFSNSKRLELYKSISNADFKLINTEIENPTMQQEIYEKIKNQLSMIKMSVTLNKDICFVNLSSGTPDIKSVWSVLIAIGELPSNRFHGIYAPNPDFDNKIRIDDLKFYKNSYSYNTVKLFIKKFNYLAISEIGKLNKDVLKDITDSDFINIVDFAKYRSTCDYENAEKIYKEKKLNKYFEYIKPTSLFEKSCEYLQSAKISYVNNDEFSTTIKLGIIRENILEYLVDNLLGYSNIGIREQEDKPYSFDLKKIRTNEPELETFLIERQKNAQTTNKEFNFKGEINAYSKMLIIDYLINNKYSDELLKMIKKKLDIINGLVQQRNAVAHNIIKPKYRDNWFVNIEEVLKLMSKYFNISYCPMYIYENINKILENKLKIQN